MTRRPRAGFTLIEILLVVVILGILMAVVIPMMIGSDRPAKITATKANLQNMRTVITQFYTVKNRYPDEKLNEILSETYSASGKKKRFLKRFPKEMLSSDRGSNKIHNSLGKSGGWYYDDGSAEVSVNLDMELGDEWDMPDGVEKNPSKW